MTENADLTRKKSEWLILVYLAGDNNLGPNSIAFLQELEAAKHNPKVRILAGFDPPMPLPKGARYLEIKRHRESANPFSKRMNWPLHNDMLSPGHIVVSPDFCGDLHIPRRPTEPTAAKALARFLEFARKNYEGKRTMLILFGHGTLVAGNTFLGDTNPPSFLKLDEFAEILRNSFKDKIDILACDNCVMNGIEMAVELGSQVECSIGSQGLMLAVGWPFRKIIETVGDNIDLPSTRLAEKILRVCARNLLDFTLMERSSEQAVCDLTKFGRNAPFVKAVRELSRSLKDGLVLNKQHKVRFPIVRSVVRQARLEAQSYFGESFVDLFDFCELLVLRCNEELRSLTDLAKTVFPDAIPKPNGNASRALRDRLLNWPGLKELEKIAKAAGKVIDVFRSEKIVPSAYYVGAQLQYSHGLSVFFPWTLPEGPITFEPIGSGSRPTDFELRTPFLIYQNYKFATKEFGDWASFLKEFFRATLRDVRRFEFNYIEDNELFFRAEPIRDAEKMVPAIDLRKSSSDTGEEDECDCPRIKNYPRRFYLSPADCKRRVKIFGLEGSPEPSEKNVVVPAGKVMYLGWNIRGLVAEEIGLPPNKVDGNDESSPPAEL